jgi:hypothetical protein
MSPRGRLFSANALAASEGKIRAIAVQNGMDADEAVASAMGGLGYSAAGGRATRIDGPADRQF